MWRAGVFRVSSNRQSRAPTSASRYKATKLYKNEADISLAARAFATSCVVLTCDRKPGPLRDAYEQGGSVIYLNDFATSGLSLRDYIEKTMVASNGQI